MLEESTQKKWCFFLHSIPFPFKLSNTSAVAPRAILLALHLVEKSSVYLEAAACPHPSHLDGGERRLLKAHHVGPEDGKTLQQR